MRGRTPHVFPPYAGLFRVRLNCCRSMKPVGKGGSFNFKGLTLAELLVTVSIVIILVSISIPVYLGQVGKARDVVAVETVKVTGGLLQNARAVRGYAHISGGVVSGDKVEGGVLEVGSGVFDVSARLGLGSGVSVVPSFSGVLPERVERFCVEVTAEGSGGSAYHMTEESSAVLSGGCPVPYPPL